MSLKEVERATNIFFIKAHLGAERFTAEFTKSITPLTSCELVQSVPMILVLQCLLAKLSLVCSKSASTLNMNVHYSLCFSSSVARHFPLLMHSFAIRHDPLKFTFQQYLPKLFHMALRFM